MKNRYKVSLLVIAILLAFSMTVGTSYAFWSTTLTQTNTNEVASGCLSIEINDLDVDGLSTSINLTNTYPMSDAKGLNTEPYTLTIKNTCSINASYKVLLNTLTTSALTESEMKYHFVKISPIETTMTPALVNTMTLLPYDSSFATDVGVNVSGTVQNTYELGNGVLSAQTENVTDSVTYNLRLWIDETAGNSVMGSTFQAAIAVYAEATN